MDQLKPVATTSHGSKKVFVHPALKTCSHVFVRHDAVKNHYRRHIMDLVLKRTEKMFTIEKNGKHSTINIACLKPAFFRELSPFICTNNFTATSCSSDFNKAST
ncbi:transposon Ty3-I Gag-Pol polyprotein [Trichonephila clavata]|uniref:Transposon Ty3-I Gag-Pol polyprotein n=1 Tax=Trichonephila clavata TaxID=2740835 RepID=A0A8X6JHS0_TRICU|nr:transposon Ty3-I Gag-Pol polyprotein [Trichonephila clavata]